MINLRRIIYKTLSKIEIEYYNYIFSKKYFDSFYSKLSKYHIKSIKSTSIELKNSNKSIGRFGDGELLWLFGKKNQSQNGSRNFEKFSLKLSKRLLEVFNSNEKDFMVSVPDSFKFININKFTSIAFKNWKMFMLKNRNNIFKYLNKNKQYYNTSITRPYIDYNSRKIAYNTFKILKNVWKNKKVLIVEGNESRLGLNDDLFDNVTTIKRIECPSTNAFESYNEIYNSTLKFLNNNDQYLTLISLGPTATILSYDIFKNGFRAIDVGHIDMEYEWYLSGAKERINLPYKYINELNYGHSVLPVHNKKYEQEIIKRIK